MAETIPVSRRAERVNPRPGLLSIIAHARSGALDRAWAMFRDGGYDGIDDDPAVLSVKGRLLKDMALAASGEIRRQYYRQAAGAYGRAAAIGGTAYPLINAATLAFLADDADMARVRAEAILARADDEAETPYYRAATRAEALLLLGDTAQARVAFDAAVKRAPLAFEDHASTLRQFGLILDARGEDRTWLDAYRPPRSLHFAGHIMLASESGALAEAIRAFLATERIGFGFGALAAGADILIAEALLAADAELHLVLPAPTDAFRSVSVSRFGADWARRFDAAIAAAASVHAIDGGDDPLSPLAWQLAADVAMGKAAMQAELLMTEAVQLVVSDQEQSDGERSGGSAWAGASWRRSGRRQCLLQAQRSARDAEEPAAPPSQILAALLRIEIADPARAVEILASLADVLAAGPAPLVAARWTGDAVLVGYEAPSLAAGAARSVARSAGGAVGIAGHCAVVTRAADPFGGAPLAFGPAIGVLARIAASTPAGAVHVSEDFAAALHAGSIAPRPRTEMIGELPAVPVPMRLFSLKG